MTATLPPQGFIWEQGQTGCARGHLNSSLLIIKTFSPPFLFFLVCNSLCLFPLSILVGLFLRNRVVALMQSRHTPSNYPTHFAQPTFSGPQPVESQNISKM